MDSGIDQVITKNVLPSQLPVGGESQHCHQPVNALLGI